MLTTGLLRLFSIPLKLNKGCGIFQNFGPKKPIKNNKIMIIKDKAS
jgi:hypothetical protein